MALSDIDHIVVLMLENRSFDGILGKLYSKSEGFDGLAGGEANEDLAGNLVTVWSDDGTDRTAMSIPNPDPGELFTDINTQLFGTADVPDPHRRRRCPVSSATIRARTRNRQRAMRRTQ
jgi:phospholipase C